MTRISLYGPQQVKSGESAEFIAELTHGRPGKQLMLELGHRAGGGIARNLPQRQSVILNAFGSSIYRFRDVILSSNSLTNMGLGCYALDGSASPGVWVVAVRPRLSGFAHQIHSGFSPMAHNALTSLTPNQRESENIESPQIHLSGPHSIVSGAPCAFPVRIERGQANTQVTLTLKLACAQIGQMDGLSKSVTVALDNDGSGVACFEQIRFQPDSACSLAIACDEPTGSMVPGWWNFEVAPSSSREDTP